MALFNPPVPCTLPLTQLRTNDLLFIYGVPHSGEFTLDLETDSGDSAFHFNPRFSERKVVRNSRIGGSWGGEERNRGFPFQEDQLFEIAIIVEDAQYKVAVNGAPLLEYNHRIPKEAVRRLVIKGSIQLQSVLRQPPNFYGFYPKSSVPICPIVNPPVPYTGKITGGLTYGRIIRVNGVAHGNRFTINLQAGGRRGANIGLHFDVRFNHGSDRNVVVRNSLINGSWGGEERHGPHFPFAKNAAFDIIIFAAAGAFMVAVNNQHYISYTERLPLASIDHFNINGDCQVNTIQFQ